MKNFTTGLPQIKFISKKNSLAPFTATLALIQFSAINDIQDKSQLLNS